MDWTTVQPGKTLTRKVYARLTDVGNKTLFITLRYRSEGKEGEVSKPVVFTAFVCGSGERFCDASQGCEREAALSLDDPCSCGFQCTSGSCEDKRCAERARGAAGSACKTGDDCESGACDNDVCVLPEGDECTANSLCKSKNCDDGHCCPAGNSWIGAENACVDLGERAKALEKQLPLSWDLSSFGLMRSDSLEAEYGKLKTEVKSAKTYEEVAALETRMATFSRERDRFRMLFYGQFAALAVLVLAFLFMARRTYAGIKHPKLQLESLTRSLTGGQENTVEVRVNNLGKAPARNVRIKVLPSESFIIDQNEVKVEEEIPAALRRDLSITLTPRESGENTLKVEVTYQDVQDRKYYETSVFAFDVSTQVVLKRDIVPAGEHVLFRIKVMNKTDDAIHDVRVVAEVPSVADFVEPPHNTIEFHSITGNAADTAIFRVLMRGCAINELFSAAVSYKDRKNTLKTVTCEVRDSIVCPALIPSDIAQDYMNWKYTTKRFETGLDVETVLEKVMGVMAQWFKLYGRWEGDPTTLLFSSSTKHTKKGYVIYMSVGSQEKGSVIDMYAYAEDPHILSGGIKNVMDGLKAHLD